MAPQNVLLLTFWLIATAISVTYVTLRPEPVLPGRSVSSQQEDVQGLRDRPLGSWGTYLPRPILSKEAPTAVAKAPSLGREPPVPFQKVPIVPVPKVEPTVPHPSEPSAVAEAASQKRAHDALFGAENEQLALKSIPAKASKPKPTAQLPSARKKVITEVRKRRFARRGGDRGLGLFALSGDFGRRQGY
jgi:hypothetical protein